MNSFSYILDHDNALISVLKNWLLGAVTIWIIKMGEIQQYLAVLTAVVVITYTVVKILVSLEELKQKKRENERRENGENRGLDA